MKYRIFYPANGISVINKFDGVWGEIEAIFEENDIILEPYYPSDDKLDNYLDNCSIWPNVDFLSILMHNGPKDPPKNKPDWYDLYIRNLNDGMFYKFQLTADSFEAIETLISISEFN